MFGHSEGNKGSRRLEVAGAAELSQTEPGYWVAAGPEGVGGVNCRTHWDWDKQWLNPRSEEQKNLS